VPEARVANNDSSSSSHTHSQNVAVIGGSAAGLFAASLLARKGIPVRVFERIETLEPAARTLIVTHRMKSLLGPAAERSIVNEIRHFELFTDGRSANVSLKHPDLIIERRALIQGLAEEAQKAGASLSLGHRFHALHPNGRGLILEVEHCASGRREEVHSDTIVGGDGHATQYSARVVRSAGHALFLLADSRVSHSRRAGIDRRKRRGHPPSSRTFSRKAKTRCDRISGRADPCV
jgi:flavin-dependent dehydrogenase